MLCGTKCPDSKANAKQFLPAEVAFKNRWMDKKAAKMSVGN